MLHIIDDNVYLFDERYTKNFVTMYYYYFHTQLVSPTGSVSIVINEDDTVNIEKTSFICKIENPFYYSYNYEYYLDRDLILRKRERKQVNNNRLVYDINISKKYLTQAIEEIGVGVSFGIIIEYIRNKVENIKEKSPTCIIFHNNRGYIISEVITGPRAVNKYKSIVAARIFDKMSYRDRISATVIKEHMSLYSDNIYTDINCREVVFNIDQCLVGAI